MADTEALLRAAVAADPADDTPRLAYADCLDELAAPAACPKCRGTGSHALDPYALAARYGRGTATRILEAAACTACGGSGTVSDGRREHAAFVRAHIALAATTAASLRLQADVAALWQAAWPAVVRGLPLAGDGPALGPDFTVRCGVGPDTWVYQAVRGFVGAVEAAAAAWLAHGPAVARGWPVEAVTLSDLAPVEDAASHPAGRMVTPRVSSWDWYYRYDGLTFGFSAGVPEPLFDRLAAAHPGGVRGLRTGFYWVEFPARGAALAALSAAALAWARDPTTDEGAHA